jgi:hypothetical protein
MNHIFIINDIKNTSSSNVVNERGRKLCPITFDILTSNNSIIIENVIYSMKGFSNWIRTELEKNYNKLCYIDTQLSYNNNTFFTHLQIRSPITNLYYDSILVSHIYNIFIAKYDKQPIECIYDFIRRKLEIGTN